MTAMKICLKHEQGHRVTEPCPYCEDRPKAKPAVAVSPLGLLAEARPANFGLAPGRYDGELATAGAKLYWWNSYANAWHEVGSNP